MVLFKYEVNAISSWALVHSHEFLYLTFRTLWHFKYYVYGTIKIQWYINKTRERLFGTQSCDIFIEEQTFQWTHLDIILTNHTETVFDQKYRTSDHMCVCVCSHVHRFQSIVLGLKTTVFMAKCFYEFFMIGLAIWAASQANCSTEQTENWESVHTVLIHFWLHNITLKPCYTAMKQTYF